MRLITSLAGVGCGFGGVLLVASLVFVLGCTGRAAVEAASAGVSEAAVAEQSNMKGPNMVRVRVIGRDGKLTGPVDVPKVELSDEEWQKRLTPEQFAIVRAKGTERPFCGTLLDNKKEGYYVCVACGLPLFHSGAKFNSGTGWPSFFQPIAEENILEEEDLSHGMVRTEIMCKRCEGHLGHVFEDGPRPTGLRYCLNSESLRFVDEADVATLAEDAPAAAAEGATATSNEDNDMPRVGDKLPAPAKDVPLAKAPGTATAVFAGGCFWCTEAVFQELNGVSEVVSGYSGGEASTANYETVCSGETGHAEAIRISYDPSKLTYGQLLRIFFATHDPTTLNRQNYDVGTQYRSAIFYDGDLQKDVAEAYIRQLTEAKAFKRPIVTTLEPLKAFYPAEDYHQDFADRNPSHPYIRTWAKPKVEKVREMIGNAEGS